jgi:hypothetical protein
VQQPKTSAFVAGNLGQAVQLLGQTGGFSLSSFGQAAVAMPGHSFTFWVTTSTASVDDTLLDFVAVCSPANGASCGGQVLYVAAQKALSFSFITTSGITKSATIPIGFGSHSVVIAEQLEGVATQSVTIFVDGGAPTVLAFGSGSIITAANNVVRLPSQGGWILDEYQFWPRDLSADPETLCENGFDGELDPLTGACSLTSN